jgi:hypothetical protein
MCTYTTYLIVDFFLRERALIKYNEIQMHTTNYTSHTPRRPGLKGINPKCGLAATRASSPYRGFRFQQLRLSCRGEGLSAGQMQTLALVSRRRCVGE